MFFYSHNISTNKTLWDRCGSVNMVINSIGESFIEVGTAVTVRDYQYVELEPIEPTLSHYLRTNYY